jgi:hypothetical protein
VAVGLCALVLFARRTKVSLQLPEPGEQAKSA